MERRARYGPTDRYDDPPAAGFCISVFALVRRGDDGSVLVGIPRKVKRWRQDWLYSKRETEGQEIFEQWRLPSCYLKEGEHPRSGLDRIMREQLGIKRFNASPTPVVLSYYSPSDWYPGNRHWDLAFVYAVSPRQSLKQSKTSKWWRKLDFVGRGKEFRSRDFGWNSDLNGDLGLT